MPSTAARLAALLLAASALAACADSHTPPVACAPVELHSGVSFPVDRFASPQRPVSVRACVNSHCATAVARPQVIPMMVPILIVDPPHHEGTDTARMTVTEVASRKVVYRDQTRVRVRRDRVGGGPCGSQVFYVATLGFDAAGHLVQVTSGDGGAAGLREPTGGGTRTA